MVNSTRNIIIGESNVGRSTFLYRIANTLSECGYSVCLIDGDGSGIEYTLNSDIIHFLNKNDVRLFKMINEIGYINIILIDDVGYLSNECLSEISKSQKNIISTCFNGSMPTQICASNYIMKSKIFKLTKTTIEIDNNIIDRVEYLTQLKREIKLKSLLNEK